jgi:crossover junction endodeoxyribonuclease RusA
VTTHELILPMTKPPLTLNGGTGNRYARAALIKTIRMVTKHRALGIPHMGRARITLEYVPRDTRRRDALNLAPTLKAAVDGIVDAGILVDDDDAHCEQIPRILPKGPAFNARGDRLRLVIEEIA